MKHPGGVWRCHKSVIAARIGCAFCKCSRYCGVLETGRNIGKLPSKAQRSSSTKQPTSLRRCWPSFQACRSERSRLPMGLTVTCRPAVGSPQQMASSPRQVTCFSTTAEGASAQQPNIKRRLQVITAKYSSEETAPTQRHAALAPTASPEQGCPWSRESQSSRTAPGPPTTRAPAQDTIRFWGWAALDAKLSGWAS